MTKVKIDSPGVTIEIEADGTLDDVSAKAMELYQSAGGWPTEKLAGAVGFTTEKVYSPRPQTSTMWQQGQDYPVQVMA